MPASLPRCINGGFAISKANIDCRSMSMLKLHAVLYYELPGVRARLLYSRSIRSSIDSITRGLSIAYPRTAPGRIKVRRSLVSNQKVVRHSRQYGLRTHDLTATKRSQIHKSIEVRNEATNAQDESSPAPRTVRPASSAFGR